MKNLSIVLVLLSILSVSAFAVEWQEWEVVDNTSGNLDQAAMDVRQGMVAMTYQKSPVSGNDAKLLYSEYI